MLCVECKTGTLSSSFEESLATCSSCAAKLVEKAHKLEDENLKLQEKVTRTNGIVENLLRSYTHETTGMMAAAKGLGRDQNPHGRGTVEADAWDVGWCRGEMDRRTMEAASVIEWAVLNLDVIEDLAKGYGQTEIADKLSTVTAKLADFVEVT